MSYEEIPVHRVTLWLCDLCLNGAGGECHTPGCALWINRAPDLPLRNSPMVTVHAEPILVADDKLAAMLDEIRARGYRNGAYGAQCARLSDSAAVDVPRLLAALDLLLKEHASYVTRDEHDRLVAILTGEETPA